MTLIETLFGGTLFILVLHFGLRRAGIGNYWCSVISGVVPTFAYMAYALRDWPGGDVVTVHVTVYLAATAVTGIIGARKTGPREKKLHWAPLLLAGFFFGLAVLMAVFTMIATRGLPPAVAAMILPTKGERPIHTAFAGVVPHDQHAAKTISQHLKQQDRLKKLGWHIEVEGLDSLKTGQAGDVRLHLADARQHPVEKARVALNLQQLAVASGKPLSLQLQEITPGVYAARIVLDHGGRWLVTLQVEQGGNSYQTEHSITVGNAG